MRSLSGETEAPPESWHSNLLCDNPSLAGWGGMGQRTGALASMAALALGGGRLGRGAGPGPQLCNTARCTQEAAGQRRHSTGPQAGLLGVWVQVDTALTRPTPQITWRGPAAGALCGAPLHGGSSLSLSNRLVSTGVCRWLRGERAGLRAPTPSWAALGDPQAGAPVGRDTQPPHQQGPWAGSSVGPAKGGSDLGGQEERGLLRCSATTLPARP